MEDEEGELFLPCRVCSGKCYKIHGKYHDKQCSNGSVSFFKVMLGDFSDRLRIPPAFVSQLMNKKDKHVVMLQGPTGQMWEVELSPNAHNTLEIRHGWKEFAHFYSLEMGDFLVFNYVRNSYIEVRIYGRSGCEKKIIADNLKNPDTFSNERHRPNKMQTSNKQMGKRMVNRLVSHEENNEEYEAVTEIQTTTKKSSIPASAASFKSNKPFHKMIMKSWNVNGPYMLTFPGAWKYQIRLPETKSEVLLLNGKCKKWKVNCILRKKMPTFSGGWIYFTRDNNLKEGDICIFEQLKSNLQYEFIFRVHIFHRPVQRNGIGKIDKR